MQTERERPRGVTILGILGIIGGIVGIFLGSAFLALGPIISAINQITADDISDNLESDGFSVNSTDVTDITTMLNDVKYLNNFLGHFLVIGIYLILLGIASFINAWGLLKGKGWAWIFAIIVYVASIILGIIIIAAFGIAEDIQSLSAYVLGFMIYGIILWYLFRPNVRSYFGKAKIETA